jgi:hypothetical protein
MALTREPRGEIKIACGNCHFVTKYSVSYIEDAISDGLKLTCSVCEDKFKVVVVPLETIAVQQNAHLTGGGLCAECDSPSWAHGAIGHDFIAPHPQVA